MIDWNILTFFIKISFIVKLIILLLASFSIISWSIIIHRIFIIECLNVRIKKFETKFWSGIEINKIYQDILKYKSKLIGLEKIFFFGFREFSRLERIANISFDQVINSTSRVIRISIDLELETLDRYIPFLGTIGSISPYVGLLGTIWGLIHSFNKLGNIQHVTLQIIAPGIAEALFSTAIGLFASIPAIIAFNHLNISINKIEKIYNNFMEEFIEILYKQNYSILRIKVKKDVKNELSKTDV
ncbi:protein TolQ [Blochmannia endosymbiont of Colobopsis nipponica]|uniref:protein TolQ n=1 Tax=Blochmannia endosymbiont of Colobopsis nipponica TaxID=2681987 RepID=UPI001781094A|nr:protein TolQ [Blochmannia endosymbiont of Colobopsis nipponica]QOI11109.1 protein TolQ [Blochmannia endosymbiont of Colobopsis nipponica]